MQDDTSLPANSAGFDQYFTNSLARMAPEGSREDRLLVAIAKALDCLSEAGDSEPVGRASAVLREAIAADR